MPAGGMSRAVWRRNRPGWVTCGAYRFVLSNKDFDEIFPLRPKKRAQPSECLEMQQRFQVRDYLPEDRLESFSPSALGSAGK
jgi:hypothetical protein